VRRDGDHGLVGSAGRDRGGGGLAFGWAGAGGATLGGWIASGGGANILLCRMSPGVGALTAVTSSASFQTWMGGSSVGIVGACCAALAAASVGTRAATETRATIPSPG
jgi:hypothetical protein